MNRDHQNDGIDRRRFLRITAVGAAGAVAVPAVGSLINPSVAEAAPAITAFTHPGILHNINDLNRIRSNVAAGTQPWLNGWNVFKASSYSQSSYTMQGPLATVNRGSDSNTGNDALWSDANAAYQNAIMWYVTRDTAYAGKALQIIKGWSSTLTTIGGTDAKLAAGIYGAKLAAGAEIMRYTGPSGSWSATEIAQTESMFRNVFLPRVVGYDDSGWGVMCVRGVMQIGTFLNDTSVFNNGLDAAYDNSCCSLGRMFLASGECAESGRDQGHTQLILGAFAECAQTAWIQGVDMYSAANYRLLAGFEYTASYNLGNTVSFVPFGGCKVTYNSISASYRGEFRPIYEMVYNHYTKRAGQTATYTSQVASRLRPEGAAFQGDHPGFGTLLFSL